jgi:hypothetical protein
MPRSAENRLEVFSGVEIGPMLFCLFHGYSLADRRHADFDPHQFSVLSPSDFEKYMCGATEK